MGIPGAGEWWIILLIVLLIFGASRVPKLARSMGQAGKEFKEGMKEGYKEQPVEGPCQFCNADVSADSKFCPGCARSAEDIVAEKNKRVAAASEAKTKKSA